MANHLEALPLFPLHAVLFPFARVQLHIFEERYRELVRHCEEFDSPFGVVLIRSGEEVNDNPEPFFVGTKARIEQLLRYPDGRCHISARGEHRFRIRRIDETSHPYMVGYVEPISEASTQDENRLSALTMRTVELFSTFIQGLMARPDFNIEVQLPEDPMMLSFLFANFLELDNMNKQRLIEIQDTSERLHALIPLIEQQIFESKTKPLQKLTSQDLQDWITPN